MSLETTFQILLVLSTFLCSLVAGLLFAFAIVVMPGIKSLKDKEFIRAFQVIDGVIQNNQPLFLFVWIGSVATLLACTALGFGQLDGARFLLIISASSLYILGVQLPTFAINIPLNNSLQSLDLDTMNKTSQKRARNDFESRWNLWNSIRTVLANLVTVLLIILLLQL